MNIAQTHIFLKENKYTGMGGEKITVIKVHECKVHSANSRSLRSIYILERVSSMGSVTQLVIPESEVKAMAEETDRVLNEVLTN